MWMGFGGSPAPEGTPLDRAVRRWTQPVVVEKLDRLRKLVRQHPKNSHFEATYQLFKAKVEYDFITLLGAGGELWASGFIAPIDLASQRCPMEADLLRHLSWKIDLCEADWEDLHAVHIEIHGPAPPWEISRLKEPKTPIADRVDDLCFEAPVLRIFGENFWFRGKKQQKIIAQLVEGQKFGKPLRTRDLLDKAGCAADTLEKAFKGNPHWPKLKLHIRQKDSHCWIEMNTAAPP